MILTLDLALTTGWAIDTQPVTSSVVNLRAGSGRPHKTPGLNLWWWMGELFFRYGFTRVVQEQPFVHTKFFSGAEIPWGLTHACRMWCEHKQVPHETVPPAAIKKHATGKGNAKKEMMLATAHENWPGHAIADHNEADALWLLDLVKQPGG